jgi:hypothetical protein
MLYILHVNDMAAVQAGETMRLQLLFEISQHFRYYQRAAIAKEKFAVITDRFDTDELCPVNNLSAFAGIQRKSGGREMMVVHERALMVLQIVSRKEIGWNAGCEADGV